MTDLVNISDFSYTEGLNLGDNTKSLTYLYGLSDFWAYLFQDTNTVNLLLETSSLQASDIYSKFLQLCSGISIDNLATSANSQLLLEIISTTSSVGVTSNISSGHWVGGFTTVGVANTLGFAVGDVISITEVRDLVVYDLGGGIDIDAINEGGITSISSGVAWNGTFSITGVDHINRTLTYYQPSSPGGYTAGGMITITNVGLETYTLSGNITSARFIANRPFLPTVTLEENVDYHIDPVAGRISFAQKLSSYGFPSRITSTGVEYSLWFVDVRYDEELIYSTFSILLGKQGTKPPSNNNSYGNFLYGLFYIYTSGPTLSVIERGLNLILGIPLARDSEIVLEIRDYLSTGQSIVITNNNSYIIPFGLVPTVSVGDTLNIGDELSKWVEIIDNESMPNWWASYPVEIPPTLLPDTPPGYTRLTSQAGVTSHHSVYKGIGGVGRAAAGRVGVGSSGTTIGYTGTEYYTNWLMRNYFSSNTFLVKVNSSFTTFESKQEFESISSIISELSPTYTGAFYYYYSLVSLKPVFSKGAIGLLDASARGSTLTGVVSTTSTNTFTTGVKITGISSGTSTGTVVVDNNHSMQASSSTLKGRGTIGKNVIGRAPVGGVSNSIVVSITNSVSAVFSVGSVSQAASLTGSVSSSSIGSLIPINFTAQIYTISDTAVSSNGVS